MSEPHAALGITKQELYLESCPVESHEVFSAQVEVGAEKQDTAGLLAGCAFQQSRFDRAFERVVNHHGGKKTGSFLDLAFILPKRQIQLLPIDFFAQHSAS